MDRREERLVRNEALFRAANEQIGSVARTLEDVGGGDRPYQFMCECSNRSCDALVDIGLEAYQDVRAHPARFLVLPGHESPEIERTVERFGGYVVVEKTGEGARLAAEEGERLDDEGAA